MPLPIPDVHLKYSFSLYFRLVTGVIFQGFIPPVEGRGVSYNILRTIFMSTDKCRSLAGFVLN